MLRDRINFRISIGFEIIISIEHIIHTIYPGEGSLKLLARTVTINEKICYCACPNAARLGLSCLRTLRYTLDAIRGLSFYFIALLLESFATVLRCTMVDQVIPSPQIKGHLNPLKVSECILLYT